MAWERRNGCGGPYYTRSRWVAGTGRVVREYVGKGRAGMMAAQLDEEDRAARRRQRMVERELQAQMDETDKQIRRLCALSDALLGAELTAAGYHRHKRGEWRRRRGKGQDGGETEGEE